MPGRANSLVLFIVSAPDSHDSLNASLFFSVVCELASSCAPCARVVQSIVLRLLVAGVVYPLVLDRKTLVNDITVLLILHRLPRSLKTSAKPTAGIKYK